MRPGSAMAIQRYDLVESCHWDRAEGLSGRIGSVGADGRRELRKITLRFGFVDADGICARLRALHSIEGIS